MVQRTYIWLGCFVMGWSALALLGAAPIPNDGSGRPWLISKQGWRLVDAKGRPVVLKNNPQAKDVSFARLLAFIQTNNVNQLTYRPGQFACTEFAVKLHDDAEAAGIRCALVGVRFQRGTGHALNAFQTMDKGLVYVDCTGSPRPSPDPARYDTIGYLKVGQPYGRLPLELGAVDPNRYERYTYVMGLWRWVELESQRLQAPSGPETPDGGVLSPEEKAEQRAKIRAQLKRLQTRYDMNPAPVKSVDIWW